MLMKEIGVVFRGFVLSQWQFEKEIDLIIEQLKGAFLSAITSFTRSIFSEDLFYIESNHYTVVFSSGRINSCDTICGETIIAYAVLEKRKSKKTDKVIEKKIKPKLNNILKMFSKKYNGKNLASLDLFDSFKSDLEVIMKN